MTQVICDDQTLMSNEHITLPHSHCLWCELHKMNTNKNEGNPGPQTTIVHIRQSIA